MTARKQSVVPFVVILHIKPDFFVLVSRLVRVFPGLFQHWTLDQTSLRHVCSEREQRKQTAPLTGRLWLLLIWMTKYSFSLRLVCYYTREKSDCCQWELLVSARRTQQKKPVVIAGYLCGRVVFMEVQWSWGLPWGKGAVWFGALLMVLVKPWGPQIHCTFKGRAL